MRLALDAWQCCTSLDCQFRTECAQHATAGDFRSEDGFAPEIRLLRDPEVTTEVIVECDTAGQPDHGCYAQPLPSSYHGLGRGFRRLFQ